MTAGPQESPVRAVYDILVEEPRPTVQRYRALIHALRPLWIEEVVCPVQVTVRHLSAAAEAAASGDEPTRRARHESACAQLYRGLSTARLLTLEERLEEVVADTLLRDTPECEDGSGQAHAQQMWDGWRTH